MVILTSFALTVFASAQDSPQDVKERILRALDERMTQERRRIMERIQGILDEELQRLPIGPAATGSGMAAEIAAARARIQEQLNQTEARLNQMVQEYHNLQMQLVELRRREADVTLLEELQAMSQAQLQAELGRRYEEGFRLIQAQPAAAENFRRGAECMKPTYYALPANNNNGAVAAYNVACGLSLAGDTEVAVDWFAISMWRGIWQQQCPTTCQYDRGGTFFEHIDRDTDLNNIREDDRFKQILEFYASRQPR